MKTYKIINWISSFLPEDELNHAVSVALNVRYCHNIEICQKAALLHDVVEDGYLSLEDLTSYGISNQIVEIVDIITRRSDETYNDYINRIVSSGNIDAAYVKLADLNTNIDRCIDEPKGNLMDRYIKAKEKIKLMLI